MQVSPAETIQPAGGYNPAVSGPIGGVDFSALLAGTGGTASKAPPTEAEKKAHDAAAGLVAEALILPVLTQVRQSSFNSDGPFSPGIGEKSFGPQFDMQLADRLAHSPQMGVTNALAKRLLKRGTAKPAAKAAGNTKLDVHG